jgi:hypothetical protein
LYRAIRGSAKHNRQRIGYKRALATVVTSAIILSSVSIMGVMMLQWSNSTIIKQKQEMDEVFSVQKNKLGEDLIFENVWFGTLPEFPSPPNNYVNVTMRNVGVLGLNVTEIKFVDATSLAEIESYNFSNGGIVTFGSLSVATPHVWTTGEVINIIAHTERGNQFTTQVVAP